MTKPNQQIQKRYNSDPVYKLAPGQEDLFQSKAKNVSTMDLRVKNDENKSFTVKGGNQVSIYENENFITKTAIDTAFKNAMDLNQKKTAYNNIKKIQDGDGNRSRNNLYELESNRGAKYLLEGESVLEFDFGGTGATELQRGKLEKRFADNNAYNMYEELPLKDKELTSTWGKIWRKCLSWIPGIWSTKERNAYVRRYNEAAAYNREQARQAYGESVTLEKNGKRKTFEYIRRKDEIVSDNSTTKTRYTMAGPNLINGGDYQLDNLEEYALALGSEWLAPKLRAIADDVGDGPVPQGIKKLHVMFQGHSRGGVAASMAAMRLNKWLHDHFEEKIAKLVQFDIIQYDPVPGKFSRTGIREKAELDTDKYYNRDGTETRNIDRARYRSLGDQQNSTLIYCLRTFKDHFFTPQQVLGAKRVILTVRDHNSIFSHEVTSNKSADKKAHRSPYLDLENNKAYRGSGVNEMDEGLYFADAKNVLHRVKSFNEYKRMRDTILAGEAMDRQEKRQDVLDRVAIAWFDTHAEEGNDIENAYYKENDLGEHIKKNKAKNALNEE